MENENTSNSILVPAPTAWPFILALGLTLIFAGLVTHAVVSIVGAAILLRAAVGWWFDVLPDQKEDAVPVSLAELSGIQVAVSSSPWNAWQSAVSAPASGSPSKCILIGQAFTADLPEPSPWLLWQCCLA